MVLFLTGIDQYTKNEYNRSFTRVMNRCIVQGSGISPTLFIIVISDLRSVGLANRMIKHADKASLLVPEKTDVEISEEFSNIIKWSVD